MKHFTLLLLLGFVGGCNGNSVAPGNDGGVHDLARPGPAFDMALGPPPQGAAITTPKDQWTWVDFPDSFCDDGSTTGIGVYNSSKSQNLIIFLNGGGACWDYATCYQLNTAAHGPFQKTQFDAFAASTGNGSIFDRAQAMNPFKDWSFVFVPYCTGDVHSGNNVITYNNGPGTDKVYHHAGHANILAYLKRLGPTFASPPKLVVSGSSAGGFGALLNYGFFRWYWPQAQGYLLDDSGPPLEMGDVPTTFVMSWLNNWKLDEVLAKSCGDPCMTDLSLGVPALANAFPGDRLSLLSSEQDKTISGYFLLSGAGFQTALNTMATDRIDPAPNFHYFFVNGMTHTMLGSPANFTSGANGLWTWLGQLVTDDAAWMSTKP